MSEVTIITNNVPRWLEYGHELTDAERKEFDYLEDDELNDNLFFRYKGEVYDLNQFTRLNYSVPEVGVFKGWHAIHSDTYFSGMLVKLPEDDDEKIIVGRYYS